MQQQKQKRECPNCGGPVKRTRGTQTRKWYWECINKGAMCFRKPVRHEA